MPMLYALLRLFSLLFLLIVNFYEIKSEDIVSEETPRVFNRPRYPSLAQIIISEPSLSSPNLSVLESIQNCFTLLSTAVRVIHDNSFVDYGHLMDVRRMYDRCVRGIPFSEYVSESSSPSDTHTLIEDYFLSKRQRMESLLPSYEEHCKKSINNESGLIELVSLERGSPTDPHKKGNFYLTSVHHLEHHADQLEYLVKLGELPPPFLDITYNIRWKVIPEMLKAVGGDDGCIYDVSTRSHSTGCHPDFRRSTFLLNPWMTDIMQGTFNTLIHMPSPLPLRSTNPFCLNPNLNFAEIQQAYLAGKVLGEDGQSCNNCIPN